MKIGIISIAAIFLLLASSALASETAASAASTNETQMNIVETAIAAGNFVTLVEAVEAAGLADTLSGVGPFTVFAPTDEAFAKIPKEQLDALIGNRAALISVLTYHVVPGEVVSSDLANGMKLQTVEGQDLTVNITDGSVMIDGAKVIQPDVMASNGVIHAIDTVLMPPAMSEVQSVMEDLKTGAEEVKASIEKPAEGHAEETVPPQQAATPAPGFEIVLALAGIMAVAYMTFGRRS
ncbi:MAG: fasciclin domain-containing protein [Methanotrichaceae archaeon]|nr:fasciclin domain-containing protein [Methanotrichaceae archaeon]